MPASACAAACFIASFWGFGGLNDLTGGGNRQFISYVNQAAQKVGPTWADRHYRDRDDDDPRQLVPEGQPLIWIQHRDRFNSSQDEMLELFENWQKQHACGKLVVVAYSRGGVAAQEFLDRLPEGQRAELVFYVDPVTWDGDPIQPARAERCETVYQSHRGFDSPDTSQPKSRLLPRFIKGTSSEACQNTHLGGVDHVSLIKPASERLRSALAEHCAH
jgi:pimeloyl-ACP methyl ester carboxylesterase